METSRILNKNFFAMFKKIKFWSILTKNRFYCVKKIFCKNSKREKFWRVLAGPNGYPRVGPGLENFGPGWAGSKSLRVGPGRALKNGPVWHLCWTINIQKKNFKSCIYDKDIEFFRKFTIFSKNVSQWFSMFFNYSKLISDNFWWNLLKNKKFCNFRFLFTWSPLCNFGKLQLVLVRWPLIRLSLNLNKVGFIKKSFFQFLTSFKPKM